MGHIARWVEQLLTSVLFRVVSSHFLFLLLICCACFAGPVTDQASSSTSTASNQNPQRLQLQLMPVRSYRTPVLRLERFVFCDHSDIMVVGFQNKDFVLWNAAKGYEVFAFRP